MKFYNTIESYNGTEKTVVTLGKFDGFHRGHQRLIKKSQELAVDGLKSLVLSFHMSKYKRCKGFECYEIMDTQEKIEFLDDKVDYFIEHPFSDKLKAVTARSFVQDILIGELNAAWVVVGQGFQFGQGGEGDIKLLRELGEEFGFSVHVEGKVSYGFETISSTYVRMEIKQGRMEIVADLLDYYYGFQGFVEHGAKLGRTIGFPTLNIKVPVYKVLPPRGVYICRVHIGDEVYFGMCNLGTKPTVSEGGRDALEVHVLDYDKDTYGQYVRVDLLQYLRMEQKFNSVGELRRQIEIDLSEVRRYISNKRRYLQK